MNLKEALSRETITPDALDAALCYLVELGVVDIPKKGKTPKGREWLARQLGISGNTVQAWISGRNQLRGIRAAAVRDFLFQWIK
jgi:hypothetical protein